SGLHFVQFGGATMRWLYFGMGLASSAMIATGLVLWVVKRRGRHTATDGVGYRLVEGFNVTAVAGLLVATATFFWANRLLPADLPAREIRELQMFFTAWILCLGHALLKIFFRYNPTWRIWTVQLSIAAILFGLLPIVNAITTESHLLQALSQGQWEVAGFDLSFLVSGLGLALTARRLDQSARASSRHWNTHPVASGG
ncbi:MAG: PepSY domain-containing protein, partial [Nitrospira sp.]|nr:PepSY domain-containing protein [Nitrospira sp.]